MGRKKWKKGKSVLPLLLSAVLVVEPFGTAATVYAEELNVPAVTEEPVQEENTDVDEDLPESGEEIKEDSENQENGDETLDSDHTDEKDEPVETPSDEGEQNKEDQDAGEEEGEDPDAVDQNPDVDDSSEEDSSVSENELDEDSVSENDLEEEQDSDLGRFSNMPMGYQLNAAQRAEKALLADEVKNMNAGDEGVLYVKGQIIVEADSQEEAEMIAEAYNAEILGFENGLLLLELSEDDTVFSALMAAASARNRLPAVWPNYYRYPYAEEMAAAENSGAIKIEETEYEADNGTNIVDADVPTLEAYGNVAPFYNDPALSSTDVQYQWQHVAVGSPYAWAEGYTGSGVKVAILDTGVKADHEDLVIAAEANATGSSLTTGSGTAADANGHGTHVAGIVGAKANNGKGGVGIAPDATLYAVNVLTGGDNAGTDWAIMQGIKQAIDWKVDIINMSLGGVGRNEKCQKVVTEAYNAGIAIFVAAGNEGVNRVNYPANYDNVICVAATDQNNSRTDFSTYGSWVDLSAPGVAIWSTYNDGKYTSMDGTSMACPVAAGEAAVILSGDDSLKGMVKNGERVDALERKMKNNVVKVSDKGIGSGVTSLTKVFNLSTAAVKPQAPTINIVPDAESKTQKVTVTITAQGGMNIYYTDNGKNPVYKNGATDVNTKVYQGAFSITEITRGSIKAIAVNESGVASAVKSASFTLTPYVNSITISGVDKVAAGKNTQLTAEVLPAYAANKKLTWKLYTASGVEATAAQDKISISTSGKVTAKPGVTVGARFTVQATAQDGSDKSATYEITVIESTKLKTAAFEARSLTLEIPKMNDPDCDLGKLLKAENVDGSAAAVTDFKWSSSNAAIARVDEKGVVQPLKAGKVTITALANDSSGKKATCAITIKQLAEKIEISGPSSVAAGKGGTFKAVITPANVTAKKVSWSVIDNTTNAEPDASTGVKINKNNGQLSTKATSKGKYTVKAEATDGSGQGGAQEVTICEGAIKTIAFSNAADKKVNLFRRSVNTETRTSETVDVKIEGTNDKADLDAYEVTSSNPGVAMGSATRKGDVISLVVRATGRTAGKTNITLAATDGSKKKVTCAVTVNNPVTKVHISSSTKTVSASSQGIDMVVVKGKSIQLKATLESEYGAVSNKKVNWSINAPASSGMTISNSGKVSAKNVDGNVWTVTAEAADGSGAKDTFGVFAVPPATYVEVPALKPEPGTIWVFRESMLNNVTSEDGKQKFLDAPIFTDVIGGYIEATSSNPSAMEVLAYYDSRNKQDYLLMSPHKVTKETPVTITVRVTDGSNKKVSYKVLVRPN